MDMNCSGNVLLPLWFYGISVHALVVAHTNARQFHARTRTCDRSACVGFSRFVKKKWFCDFNVRFRSYLILIYLIFEVYFNFRTDNFENLF